MVNTAYLEFHVFCDISDFNFNFKLDFARKYVSNLSFMT